MTVRDKLWLFASRAHDDDIFFLKGNERPKARWSRITPAEGAFMLGVPNLIMVESDGEPCPYTADAFGYLESCCRIKKLMWSVTGSAGYRNGDEEEFIRDMAKEYPNIVGAYFDDFTGNYRTKGEYEENEIRDMFAKVRNTIDQSCRQMESWITAYPSVATKYPKDMYDNIDGLIIWSTYREIDGSVEKNLKLFEEFLPEKRKMFGIYIYDYANGVATSDELMDYQCEAALKWLKEGRIEGIVFLTNCTMGIGLSSEYWLRKWIDKVGDIEL